MTVAGRSGAYAKEPVLDERHAGAIRPRRRPMIDAAPGLRAVPPDGGMRLVRAILAARTFKTSAVEDALDHRSARAGV
jgi:hypothetical protein